MDTIKLHQIYLTYINVSLNFYGQPTLTRTGTINLEELCDVQFHYGLKFLSYLLD